MPTQRMSCIALLLDQQSCDLTLITYFLKKLFESIQDMKVDLRSLKVTQHIFHPTAEAAKILTWLISKIKINLLADSLENL